jgi:transcriptional regulator with XRE-family HTH domain
MAESENLRTIKQLHEASGVSTGTIDRIRRAQVSAGVDQLTALAKPFGLEPWQMLETGIRAATPPPSRDALAVAAAYDKMTPRERLKLDHLMAVALDIDLGELELRERNIDTALGDLDEKKAGNE